MLNRNFLFHDTMGDEVDEGEYEFIYILNRFGMILAPLRII
jgi:hypothetical protein